MMSKLRIFFLCFLLQFLPLFSEDSFFGTSESQFREKIKTIQLENGLTVVMMKRGTSPTVALYIKFLVGAVDETPEEAGTAHLLEHMLFKGTKYVGTSDYQKEEKYQKQIEVWGTELDNLKLQRRDLLTRGEMVPASLESEIETLNRRLKNLIQLQDEFIVKNEDSYIYEQNGEVGFNAYTSQDVTNYQIQLPNNRIEIWAKIESDRLKDPILREYYTERDVVIEERRMRTDDSGAGVLREKFFSLAFESHPYRKPVIGYSTGLPFLKIDETKEFFKKHYTPDRMVISIVGQFDMEETESIIRKYFSDLKPGKPRPNYKVEEKSFPGEKRFKVYHPSGSQMMMGWLKPPYPHKDNSSFDVLSTILTSGTGSRLYKRLVLEEKLVLSIGAANGYPGERYQNYFVFFIKPNEGANIEKIESIIWEEVNRIKENGIPKEELDKVKNQMVSDFIKTLDENGTIADLLSYYQLLYGDWSGLFKQYQTIMNASSSEIQSLIPKYLTKENVVIGVLEDVRKK
ncbi:M16 family metallopeptidase [Leptospira levettii]|uniref:Insulinase family protein n=1 Tax=Leptospira levettii TaxID=2023178 RepID=A0ABY2MIF1_9LEPT|nr:insulinase family protein [Leptospira levettii]TGM28559.1 insulinase family protein [Leptospira levettii]TGM83292.1 insulinase family protein [Leptospira levettii]